MTGHALLAVDSLTVEYQQRRRFLTKTSAVRAVQDVSLVIGRSETLGLVGESGSGKSTTGRAILGLVPVAGGEILFDGHRIGAGVRIPVAVRRRIQVVFQDPYSSLDPTKLVRQLVAEPLRVRGSLSSAERRAAVVEAIERVGLAEQHLDRYPHEFSGGQRQRINIARALVTKPDLVILDEPVSALDVSTQSQVVNLLQDLQSELGVSFLFIAHDLAVVKHISHRTAVMYHGRIVEDGPARRVHHEPAHPYTQALLASVPVGDPVEQARRRAARREGAQGEPPTVRDVLSGCAFAPRCPHVMDRCRSELPRRVPLPHGGGVSCHLFAEPTVDSGALAES